MDTAKFAVAIKGVEKVLKQVNLEMSTYIPESSISRFNKFIKISSPFAIPEDFKKVFNLSKKIYKKTSGAYDPTIMPLVNLWGFGPAGKHSNGANNEEVAKTKEYIGFDKITLKEGNLYKSFPRSQLDFSSIAKGFGVDKVSEYLESIGCDHYFVEIGGEVRTKGSRKGKKQDEKWKVGIEIPKDNGKSGEGIQKVINISNYAVATSGSYRQFYEKDGQRVSHTLDPRNGLPITHRLSSVTIISKNTMLADALATSAMVMGEKEGFLLIENWPDVEGFFLIKSVDGKILEKQTSGFNKFL